MIESLFKTAYKYFKKAYILKRIPFLSTGSIPPFFNGSVVLSPSQIFFVSLAITTFFFTFFLLACSIKFDTNDDVIMMMIASGHFTGIPDGHLIYSNFLIGRALKLLYCVKPQLNWYPLYLLFIHFISSTVIVHSIIKKHFNSFSFLIAVIFLFIGEFHLVTNLQFTTTATIAGLAGLALILRASKSVSFEAIVGVVLFAGAGMIRENIFYMLLVIFTPLAAFQFYTGKIKLSRCVAFFVALVVFGGVKLFDHAHYDKNPEWQTFVNYNMIRGSLHNNAVLMSYKKNVDIFNKITWNKDDFIFFNTWFFEDENAFSYDKLKFLHFHLRGFNTVWDTFHEIAAAYAKPLIILQFLIIILACLIGGKDGRIRLCLLFAVICLLSIYFAFTNRIPSRIAYSFFAIPFLVSLFQFTNMKFKSFSYKHAILLFISVLAIPICVSENKNMKKKKFETISMISQLNQNFKGKTIVFLGSANILNNLNPFSMPFLSDLKCTPYMLGWASHSPLNKEILAKLGQTTIENALLKPDDFYLLVHDDEEYVLKPIERFYSRHYGINIQICKIKMLGGKISAYKLSRAVN